MCTALTLSIPAVIMVRSRQGHIPKQGFRQESSRQDSRGLLHRGNSLMHRFVKEHIVRGIWAKKERPVLLNNWEATYFDFRESRLLKLAKEAKDLGMELFVLDDGWFGERNDETNGNRV